MKHIQNSFKILVVALMALLVFSCEDDNEALGDIIDPTINSVNVEVVGQDAANPNGDGSGQIIVTINADNAFTYHVTPEGSSTITAPGGEATALLTTPGTNTYNIEVTAFGVGGASSTTTVQATVFVAYEPPAEIVSKLFGDGTAPVTWRIKSEKNKHFGLGPVGGTIPCEWYGAGPDEKSHVGMYDDRYIFTQTAPNTYTFDHITDSTNDDPTTDPSGTVFGRAGLIDEIGTGGEAEGDDIINLPYNDYSGTINLIPYGDGDGMKLSGTSFIGYYTGGSHEYEIFDISVENEITIRTVDGNNGFSWWFVLTSEE